MTDVPTAIPDDVQSLLRDHVGAYEELQILLLLHGSGERSWTSDSVAEALQMHLDHADEALLALTRAGLVSVLGHEYTFQPRELGDAVAQLSKVFEEQPLAVMNFLSTNAVDRIRTGALRAFASAFVLKGGKKDG